MSKLSEKTEYKALCLFAKMVKLFEQLHYLDMTKPDDWDAKQARNLLGYYPPLGEYSNLNLRNTKLLETYHSLPKNLENY